MLGSFPTYLHLLHCLLLPKPCKPCDHSIPYTPEASHLASTSPMSSISLQIPSDAYSLGRIYQGHLGRFEPGQGSCYPLQPWINFYPRKACSGCHVSHPYFIGYSSQKAKDCPQPICIHNAGCLVTTLFILQRPPTWCWPLSCHWFHHKHHPMPTARAGFVKVILADSSPVKAPVIPHSHRSTWQYSSKAALSSFLQDIFSGLHWYCIENSIVNGPTPKSADNVSWLAALEIFTDIAPGEYRQRDATVSLVSVSVWQDHLNLMPLDKADLCLSGSFSSVSSRHQFHQCCS